MRRNLSRQTVNVWLARGRARPSTPAGEFAARFDALRAGREVVVAEDEVPENHSWTWVLEGDHLVAERCAP